MTCAGCELGLLQSCHMDEDQVLEFLLNHRILKRFTVCPKCATVIPLVKKDLEFRRRVTRRVPSRGKVKCNTRMSARKGSFFERSRLAFDVYVKLISFLLFVSPPRQRLIQAEIHVTAQTIVNWYSFCREVFMHDVTRFSGKLGGPGTIVEIDEAKFGKRKYNVGRVIEGQWVFGGVQRNSNKSFFVPVERRDAATLLTIIKEWILPETTIISDCWRAYNCLENEGFIHLSVNHSQNFVNRVTGAHTNNIERTWREVRSNVPKYGRRKQHFAGYLAEYMFKAKYPMNERLHAFYCAAADLYPPKH